MSIVFESSLLYNISMTKKNEQKKQLFPKIVIDSRNFYIFIGGLLILILGFILLSVGPWDNPVSRSLAPITLLIAYIVVFPIAIFYQSTKKGKKRKAGK